MPWQTKTGSSRRIVSRRSVCCAGCRPRRSSPGGAGILPVVEPGRVPRRLDRRPDRIAGPARGGARLGKKLRGEGACSLAFFGDGATSEGAFHEGANLAAVMAAPAILLCNNNGWAISTPVSAQTRAVTLADKARGYGMPGVRVDGGDVLAVYEATCEAAERARAGGGPTFIEAVTYRMAPHATADDPSAYIDPERVRLERENECLGRFDRYLRRVGVLDDEVARKLARRSAGRDESRDRGRRRLAGAGSRPGLQARVRGTATGPSRCRLGRSSKR